MLIALHNLFGVLGLTRESGLFVAKTVALLIGLGEDIDTVLGADIKIMKQLNINAGSRQCSWPR